jgi:two-component system, NtrC family, sensor kinase
MPDFEWKVVIIDDEKDIRDVITMTLVDAGYRVWDAADGESGLKLCQTRSPQMVITDIKMPGMDGLQVLKHLKQTTPETEVIVATAFGDMGVAIRALQLDASDFITKPINDEALHLALNRARERYGNRKQIADYTALLEKEHAATSQELIKTFTFQRNLIESSMDGIFSCDSEDLVITYNKSMENILGYPAPGVVHQKYFNDFFSPGDAKKIKQVISSHKWGGENRLYMYEAKLLGSGSEDIPVQISAAALFEDERRNGLVFFVRDLRTIRQLEREVVDQARMLHQDKMMSLGKLAASVVHEINNPLSGILNYLRLMMQILDRGPLDEEYHQKFRRYVSLVENETDRCSRIISNLLTFSRKSPAAHGQVKIDDLLNRCVILSQHKLELSDIGLVFDVDPDLPEVTGDFSQLQQGIINLVFNAIDAMPQGGTLNLSARLSTDRMWVTLTVKDSGQGIAPGDIDHIFDPFFTTKKEGYGVGLGLSTVYGIIERHHGTIKVKSQPREGTAFVIRLPVMGGQKDRLKAIG